LLADLSGKQRAKSVPPKSSGFIADVDAAFVQKILDIPGRKQKPDRHHDGIVKLSAIFATIAGALDLKQP
jgi:hypothetical protein